MLCLLHGGVLIGSIDALSSYSGHCKCNVSQYVHVLRKADHWLGFAKYFHVRFCAISCVCGNLMQAQRGSDWTSSLHLSTRLTYIRCGSYHSLLLLQAHQSMMTKPCCSRQIKPAQWGSRQLYLAHQQAPIHIRPGSSSSNRTCAPYLCSLP